MGQAGTVLGEATPSLAPVAPTGRGAGSCHGHLLPILSFSDLQNNCLSCSFSPFALVCPEAFPWKSNAGMSHPLPVTSTV